jgi:hypothetical protein
VPVRAPLLWVSGPQLTPQLTPRGVVLHIPERRCVQKNCLKEEQDIDFAPFITESHHCQLTNL